MAHKQSRGKDAPSKKTDKQTRKLDMRDIVSNTRSIREESLSLIAQAESFNTRTELLRLLKTRIAHSLSEQGSVHAAKERPDEQ
jgi:hypothetical protein